MAFPCIPKDRRMLHVVDLPALNPGAGAQAGLGRPGLAWDFRPSRPRPAAVVSDEQTLALVAAAAGLRRRQRDRWAGDGCAAAEERRLRLDWAVPAGRFVLAARAARALTSTAGSAR